MLERSTPGFLHFEHHTQPILPPRQFLRRFIYHLLLALSLILISLTTGVLGYHYFAGFAWIDALLNASMILGGMGQINEISTHSGKVFASFYALYSGVAFLAVAAMLVAPFAHRLLHCLHLDDSAGDDV